MYDPTRGRGAHRADPMLKALKENLSLLSLMVVLAGTSSTDAYYSAFGLRYQFLSVPASHILFRGITAVWAYPLLAVPYLLALAMAAGQSRRALLLGGLDKARWANHAAVAAFVAAAWWGGAHAGDSTARSDMSSAGSGLPVVARIAMRPSATEGVPTSPAEGYRLLMQGADGIRIFKAVSDPRTESPLVRFIAMGGIDAIAVCARC